MGARKDNGHRGLWLRLHHPLLRARSCCCRQATHRSAALPLPRGGTTHLFCGRVAVTVTSGEEGGEFGVDTRTRAADEHEARRRVRDGGTAREGGARRRARDRAMGGRPSKLNESGRVVPRSGLARPARWAEVSWCADPAHLGVRTCRA